MHVTSYELRVMSLLMGAVGTLGLATFLTLPPVYAQATPCASYAREGFPAACVEDLAECDSTGGKIFRVEGGAALCPGTQVCCTAWDPATPPNQPPPTDEPIEPGKPVKLPDPLGGRNLAQIIGQAIRTFTGIAGAIALLMFVYGGVYWIYSKGESEKVSRAIEILRNAVIGLVLIFGAYFFTSSIVQGILSAPASIPTEEQPSQ